MASVSEALTIGTRHHQAGQFAEAESIYRRVLEIEPDNPQALHLLGMLAIQGGQYAAAIDWIARAIRADRRQPAFYANLGEAYRLAGHTDQAIAHYRQAVKLQGDLISVRRRLGELLHAQGKLDEAADCLREALRLRPDDNEVRSVLGRVRHDQNKLTEAETCFRRVLGSNRSSPDAHFDLGSVLQSQQKLDEAVGCYRAALELQPGHAPAHNNLGTILKERSLLAEATGHFRAALLARPDDNTAHYNLGTVHEIQGEMDQAIACYRKALRANPGLSVARNSLGALLQKQGQWAEAWECFQQVLRENPHLAAARNNLGLYLQSQEKLASAIAEFQDAIRLDPKFAEAHNNLGLAFSQQGNGDAAILAYTQAIELRPDFSLARSNLAVSLQALGRLDEAIAQHRTAVELNPSGAGEHANLLYALNFHPDYNAAAIFAEHSAWGRRHADPLSVIAAPHRNDRTPDRRLRIGYVSGHFSAHAVNFFSEPILEHHDHDSFEVFCYSNVDHPDETTARLRSYSDHWRQINLQSDEQASELVRNDQIDILVDLSGHIGGNRLLIFARKPAPVQVTYIGYQNTTGMAAMDYRLTDAYCDPPGQTDAFYTEKLVRLPRSFFCYLPSPDAPAIRSSPAIDNGYVTFGSFNNFAKVTPQALAAWARILSAVPDSRLVILADMTDSLRGRLTGHFAEWRVGAQRLQLENRRPREAYLELINSVDIALDPFPFNGHTTTCDCLWQGVPVVTLAGPMYASRFGGSALVTLGLQRLIAQTVEQYVEIAANLASELSDLRELRADLRQRMADSPLLDFQGFTRELEAEYRKLWTRWIEE